jgi:hypothetical protein
MQSVIAMAELAEAAEFYMLIIFTVCLAVVALLLLLVWGKKSILLCVIACVLCVVMGVLLQPWNVFRGPQTNDPDEAEWLFKWRVITGCWAIFSVWAGFFLRMVLRRPFSAPKGG